MKKQQKYQHQNYKNNNQKINNGQNSKKLIKKEPKEYIFTFSAIEQKRHKIASSGQLLLYFIEFIPFLVLFLELISCFVVYLDNNTFKTVLISIALVAVIFLLIDIFISVKRYFYVLMIDENGILYRLKISNFWYKIKNQTMLLNPMQTSGGRLLRMFYMINNIKIVLQNISETVTYEELISMGRLEKFTEITDVEIKEKKVCFKAKVTDSSGERVKQVKLERVFENDMQIMNYLKNEDYKTPESMSEIIEEINKDKTPIKKAVSFTWNWLCIMAWVAVVLLSSDLGKLSKINTGIYDKTVVSVEENGKTIEKEMYVSEKEGSFEVNSYGKHYKTVIVLFLSVEIVYVVNISSKNLIRKIIKQD